MREQYLKMRNSNRYDMNWFYSYFKDKGGKATPEEFELAFRMKKVTHNFAGQKIDTMENRDIKEILEELDRKFEVAILTDKTGKFIKAL